MARESHPDLLVKPSHPDYLGMVEIFGAPPAGQELRIPVTTYTPQRGQAEKPRRPRDAGPQQFFFADRSRLSPDAVTRYARNVAGFFHLSVDQVLADLKAGGPMPILYLPEHMVAPAIPSRMVL